MDRISIVYVIDFLGKGGAERQLLHLVNGIDLSRYQPSVVCLLEPGHRASELRSDIPRYDLFIRKRYHYLKAILKLRKILKKIKPRIIHSWLDYSAFVSCCANQLIDNKPIFVCGHRVSIEELYGRDVRFGWIKKKALLWAYSKSKMITTNSKSMVNQLNKYGFLNVELIYNGVEVGVCESRSEERIRLGLEQDQFIVIFVGALVRRKGVAHLINAFIDIPYTNLRLLILGDGRDKDFVYKLSQADNRIKMLGFMENPSPYIRAANLLVLPSEYEGMPNAVIEAMILGTPVIGSNMYGNSELITSGVNGILFEYGNINQIKSVLIECLQSSEKLDTYAQRAKGIAENFKIENMVKNYQVLYEGFLGT